MRRLCALIVVLAVGFSIGALTACSDLDRYRYPCQNPANFDTADCQPPICEASDVCTDDLLTRETTP